jgi:hypothetical protein
MTIAARKKGSPTFVCRKTIDTRVTTTIPAALLNTFAMLLRCFISSDETMPNIARVTVTHHVVSVKPSRPVGDDLEAAERLLSNPDVLVLCVVLLNITTIPFATAPNKYSCKFCK